MQLGGFGNFVKQLLGYGAIAFGGLFLLVAIAAPIVEPEEDKTKTIAGGLVIGLPPTVVGILLLRSSYKDSSQKEALQSAQQQQEINRVFYALTEQGKGAITLLQFASAADISLPEAKTFLDDQAKLLNANFEATQEGVLVYKFPTGCIDSTDA